MEGGGKREIIYLSLHCHHQNDSCIKMGSDGSHINVSVGNDGQSHKTVSTDHNLVEEKGEPKPYRTEVRTRTVLESGYTQGKGGEAGRGEEGYKGGGGGGGGECWGSGGGGVLAWGEEHRPHGRVPRSPGRGAAVGPVKGMLRLCDDSSPRKIN